MYVCVTLMLNMIKNFTCFLLSLPTKTPLVCENGSFNVLTYYVIRNPSIKNFLVFLLQKLF